MIPISTGTGTVINVWYACKVCKLLSFQNIDQFIEHKKEVHFHEFQKLNCIVFEERTISSNSEYNPDNSSLPQPASRIKQENILSSDYQNYLDVKPSSAIYNVEAATKAETEPTISQVKNETAKLPQNPYVLLKRLTSRKFHEYKYKCQPLAISILPNHLTILPAKGPFKCPRTNCGKVLKSRSNLNEHLVTHTTKRLFKCPRTNCGKAYKSQKNLREHLRPHTLQRQFKCPKVNCAKAFQTRGVLRHHLESHNTGRPFKCPESNCEKAYKSRRNLRTHLESHSPENKFKCQEPNCGKAFKRKENLRGHLQIHSGSRPCFHCPHPNCGKIFRQKHRMKLHVSSHHTQDLTTGVDWVKYKKCDRSCLTNYQQRGVGLVRKPVQCPQPNCTKEFKYDSALRNHLASHSRGTGKEKPYKCSVSTCNKTFKSPYYVKVHVRAHSREQPFLKATQDE